MSEHNFVPRGGSPTLSTSSSQSARTPEVRWQIAKKRAEQLERERLNDAELMRISYERNLTLINNEMELAALETTVEQEAYIPLVNVSDPTVIEACDDTCVNNYGPDSYQQPPSVNYVPTMNYYDPSCQQTPVEYHQLPTTPLPVTAPVYPGPTSIIHTPTTNSVYPASSLMTQAAAPTLVYPRSTSVAREAATAPVYSASHSPAQLPITSSVHPTSPPITHVAQHTTAPVYSAPPSIVHPAVIAPDYPAITAPVYASTQQFAATPPEQSSQFLPTSHGQPGLTAPIPTDVDRLHNQHTTPHVPMLPTTSNGLPSHPLDAYRMIASVVNDSLSLPKPELLQFDGDPKNYIRFMNNFQNNIANKLSDDGLKLNYLIQLCCGKAKDAVANYVVVSNSAQGYKEALLELSTRYGRPHIIARAYIKEIVEGPPLTNDQSALSDLAHEMKKCSLTLNNLGYLADLNNSSNLLHIVRRLPNHIRNKWIERADVIIEQGSEPTFDELTAFLMRRARISQNMYGMDLSTNMKQSLHKTSRGTTGKTVMTTQSTPLVNERTTQGCKFCDKPDHMLWTCDEFKNCTYNERLQFTRSKALCDNCLKYGHRSRSCPKSTFCRLENCDVKYRHNELLHPPPTTATVAEATVAGATVAEATVLHTTRNMKKVFLRVVPVTVRCNNIMKDVYALVDQCSDATLCSTKLARQLKANGVHRQLDLSTVNKKQCSINATEIELTVHPLRNTEQSFTLNGVLSVDHLPLDVDIPVTADLASYPYLADLNLPELPDKEIALLIGSDHPAVFKEVGPRREGNPNELYGVQTALGWSVLGPTPGAAKSRLSVNFVHQQQADDSLIQHMNKLWNTDFNDLHCDKNAMSQNDYKARDLVRNAIHLDTDKHYVAPLPWKVYPPALDNNRIAAESRLRMLKNRLHKNTELKQKYVDTISDYVTKGYVRKAPIGSDDSGDYWYLPHHPVSHPKKSKTRIVFDASAKYHGKCLNDMILQGPDLANNLLGVLLRFRSHTVALAADIKEMFHQVKLNNNDRNYMRFLFWEDGNMAKPPVDFQFLRHAFGVTSSPFVCNYALQHTANQHKHLFHEDTINTVTNNFYVDDCLKSTKNVNNAKMLVNELGDLLKMGGFELVKWASNSSDVMASIDPKKRSTSLMNFDLNPGDDTCTTESTLGLTWEVHSDTFRFTSVLNNKPLTRRGILSMTSAFFDPIGFFAPVILTGKLILQEITRDNIDWDEPVRDDIKTRWLKWLATLQGIADIRLQRCYTPVSAAIVTREMHLFCDASQQSYGVAAYMRIMDSNDEVYVSFICGKTRLAPIKSVSIPRLELCAATLASKMHTSIKYELQSDMQFENVTFWTDSTTVLHYIRNTDTRFKVFVANRLTAIHENSTVTQWRYIPTHLNPADHASRGLYGDQSTEIAEWHNGPEFLRHPECQWPDQPAMLPLLNYNPEVKVTSHVHATQLTDERILDKLLMHYSSWDKIKRSMAWLLRYRTYCIDKYIQQQCDVHVQCGELTVPELRNAEKSVMSIMQRSAFKHDYDMLCNKKTVKISSNLIKLSPIMDDKVIRVGGRLQYALISHDQKHPVILPNKHHVTDVIISHCHTCNGHVGIEDTLAFVRHKYWIINGRSAVKRVLSKCQLCRRHNARAQEQFMAPLPMERLVPYMPAFTYVAIDYFGPLYVKQRRSHVKRYGCIFVCNTTRAVHMEVAHSLDTDSFLCCMQRFINRRGTPQKCFSDNGTNLSAGERELRECINDWNQRKINKELQKRCIEWHFNTPTASHMGGAWERIIRSTRSILRKILREQIVSDEVMMTVLTEIERILNDRPLTKVSTDPNDESVLTPSMLLLLKNNSCIPPGQFDANEDYAKRSWRQSQHISNTFWRRWIRQYLPTLQSRQKWNVVRENIKIGDIVLLADDHIPRGRWPLARVTSTRPDRHGHVRSVIVWANGSSKCRPVTKLVLLERS